MDEFKELGLETVRTTGRAAVPIEVEIGGELTRADLESRSEERATKAPALTRLSQRHHQLARFIADGTPIGTAAIVCGYTPTHASILNGDPAFRNLVRFYQDAEDISRLGTHEKLTVLANECLDEITHRLENKAEDISTAQLQAITILATDRIGHGPQTSSLNTNVNINTADRLKRARERVQTIEATAKEIKQ